MYIGKIGVLMAARKPINISVLNGRSFLVDLRDNRPICSAGYQIGNYTKEYTCAMFDTGSTDTVICLPNARQLVGIDPYDKGLASGFNGDLIDVEYYERAKLMFPYGLEIETDLISVHGGRHPSADIIIGMDIISRGKLTINGKDGTFSFGI